MVTIFISLKNLFCHWSVWQLEHREILTLDDVTSLTNINAEPYVFLYFLVSFFFIHAIQFLTEPDISVQSHDIHLRARIFR